MLAKWWKFITKKHSITSLIFILSFPKNEIRFIMISNIEINFFQINFDVGFVCVYYWNYENYF
jgi:hypothetical protein